MPAPADGNCGLVPVIAFMRAARGKREELTAALEALTKPAKREDGYVNYDPRQGAEGPRASSSSARTGARARGATRTSPPRWA